MLRLNIQRAAPGMVLATPVLHPLKPEHVLLRPGVTLDSGTIARLEDLDVRTIYIEYPPTAYLLRYVNPGILAEQGRLAASLSTCFDAARDARHAEFDFLEYLTGVRSLVHALSADPDAGVFIQDLVEARGPLANHSFNVGFLSLLMGMRLDSYLVASRPRVQARRARGVENLAIGGLLHDVGMLHLEEGAAERYYRTGDQNDPAWKEHTKIGYAMVRGRISPTAAAAVLNHHQRLDGSGFPSRPHAEGPARPLSGRGIHVFARVVAVADAFETARRPFDGTGRSVPTVAALRATAAQVRAGWLDPVAFRALLTIVPAFAPGSLCTLNDGGTYIVAGWNPSRPCRPMVCPLPAGEIRPQDASAGPTIDLRTRKALQVVSSEGVDVRADLFDERYPGEFDAKSPIPRALVEPTPESGMSVLARVMRRVG